MELSTSFKGKNLAYAINGNGRDVILLHGFLENKSMWEDLVLAISSQYRTIAIDLPGHGNTDSFSDYHSMDLMAECVKHIIQKEKIKHPILIGHSMGGYVSLALTEIQKDIESIILYHSTSTDDSPEKKKDRDRAINVIDNYRENFILQSIPNLVAEENRPRLENEIKALIKEASNIKAKDIKAALAGMRDRKNYFENIDIIGCPVYLILGEKDTVLTMEKMKGEVDHTGIETFVMKNSGHMSFIESPMEYKKIIKSILTKVSSRRN